MTNLLPPTAPNFRAERGRYEIDNAELVNVGAATSVQMVGMLLSTYRPFSQRSRMKMAAAFNELVGRELFSGVLQPGETDKL